MFDIFRSFKLQGTLCRLILINHSIPYWCNKHNKNPICRQQRLDNLQRRTSLELFYRQQLWSPESSVKPYSYGIWLRTFRLGSCCWENLKMGGYVGGQSSAKREVLHNESWKHHFSGNITKQPLCALQIASQRWMLRSLTATPSSATIVCSDQ